ncbi:hypothetical protein INT44_002401, partial [Umbelopsis vinacea]
MGMQQRPQMAGLHQGLTPQQLLQQQQQQQQQQSIPQGMPASPIWTGHIVWSIKTPHGALTEFACHCGAYPVALRGSSNTAVAVDGYQPELWPQRIQITGLSPLAKATLLQKQALENNLPYCQFRPSANSTSQDVNNFSLLTKNLEQRKFVSILWRKVDSSPGATGMQEQHHGLVLIYSAGKLIGIVFTKIPIPDIANMPTPGVPANAPPAAANKPPNNPAAMLNANMQPTTNTNLAANLMNNNNNNNANMQMLRNLTRHQQQMMTTAAGGNPAGGAVQPGQNGKKGKRELGEIKEYEAELYHLVSFRLECKQS